MKKRLVMISLVPSPAFLCEMNLSSARELHFRLQETGDEAAGTFFFLSADFRSMCGKLAWRTGKRVGLPPMMAGFASGPVSYVG